MCARTTSLAGSSGGGRTRATASAVVRQARVSTSTLRKVNGNGGMVGASHGVEKPGWTMSSTVRRARPPLRRSLLMMRSPAFASHSLHPAALGGTVERVEHLHGALADEAG